METTKPFPLTDPLFLQNVSVQKKPDFRFISDENLGLNAVHYNKTLYLNF